MALSHLNFQLHHTPIFYLGIDQDAEVTALHGN
jgi:hypothetical protein